MSQLLWEIFGAWVRAGLMALSTYLVNRQILTSSQGERLASELFTYAMMIAPAVGALGWTTYQKLRMRVKLHAAMDMAGVSEDELHAAIKIAAEKKQAKKQVLDAAVEAEKPPPAA